MYKFLIPNHPFHDLKSLDGFIALSINDCTEVIERDKNVHVPYYDIDRASNKAPA